MNYSHSAASIILSLHAAGFARVYAVVKPGEVIRLYWKPFKVFVTVVIYAKGFFLYHLLGIEID